MVKTEIFEVEKVIGRRIVQGKTQYLLKWVGYDECTWQDEKDCSSCRKLVDDFEKANATAPSSSSTQEVKRGRGRSSLTIDSQSSTEDSQLSSTSEKEETTTRKRSGPPRKSGGLSAENGSKRMKDELIDDVFTTTPRSRGRPPKGKESAKKDEETKPKKIAAKKEYFSSDDSDGGSARDQRDHRKSIVEASLKSALIPIEKTVYEDSSSSDRKSRTSRKVAVPRIFKQDELPGMAVFTTAGYLEWMDEEGRDREMSLDDDNAELIFDKAVASIIGYMPSGKAPFCIVKTVVEGKKKDIPITDYVYGLDAVLAARLIPKAFADFTTRLAYLNGGEKNEEKKDNVAGPSSSNKRRASRN